MENRPIVSVVIPVYNCESTIRRSLSSIRNQTYRDFETIIVNNNCSDNTISIILDEFQDLPNLKVVHCKHQGIVPALNTGLRHASGEWIARQDGDDYWHPDKLEKQMSFLLNNPEVSILGTGINIFNTSGDQLQTGTMGNPVDYPPGDHSIKTLLLYGQNAICHPSVVFNIKVVNTIGGYEQLFPLAEDLHMWLKAIPHFLFANLKERLVDYTQKQDDNYDARVPVVLADWFYALYKDTGVVEGERQPRIYDWQLDPSHHGNPRKQ
jgi:hypothetical protein